MKAKVAHGMRVFKGFVEVLNARCHFWFVHARDVALQRTVVLREAAKDNATMVVVGLFGVVLLTSVAFGALVSIGRSRAYKQGNVYVEEFLRCGSLSSRQKMEAAEENFNKSKNSVHKFLWGLQLLKQIREQESRNEALGSKSVAQFGLVEKEIEVMAQLVKMGCAPKQIRRLLAVELAHLEMENHKPLIDVLRIVSGVGKKEPAALLAKEVILDALLENGKEERFVVEAEKVINSFDDGRSLGLGAVDSANGLEGVARRLREVLEVVKSQAELSAEGGAASVGSGSGSDAS